MSDGGEARRDERRKIPDDADEIDRADEQIHRGNEDERVRVAVDGPSVSVVFAGSGLRTGRVVADRPRERPDEDADAERPEYRPDETDLACEVERPPADEEERPPGGQRQADRRRAGGRQVAGEVRRDERVRLPEEDVEDEPQDGE